MPRFTLPERVEIIKKYYRNSGSVVNTLREFRRELGRHHGFSVQAIRRIVDKFEREYTLLDLKPPTRKRLVRNEENIAAVAASIEEDPEMSIRRRSAKLGIARESIRLIVQGMKEDNSECEEKASGMKENYPKELKANDGTDTGAKKRKTKTAEPGKKQKKKETSEEECGED